MLHPQAHAETVTLGPEISQIPLTPHLEFLIDPSGSLNFEEIRRSSEFKPLDSSTLNLGITRAACWVRATLLNRTQISDWVLEIAYPPLDYIDLFVEEANGSIVQAKSGDRLPFDSRYVPFRNSNFRVDLPTDVPVQVWIRVETSSALQLPVELYTTLSYAERIADESFGFGLYYGLLLMVLAFNVVLALMTRDSIYVGYIGYLVSYLVFQLSLNGYLFAYILGDSPSIANALLLLSFFLAVVGALTFTRIFLELSTTLPSADRALKWASYACLSGTVAAIFLDYATLIGIAAPVGVVFPGLVLWAGIQVWRQGHKHARLFVVAWSCFLVACVIFGLRALGLLPANAFTLYAIQVGSTLEVLLLTVAIGDRITRLRTERDSANDALTDSYALLDEEMVRRDKLRSEVNALREEVARTSNQLISADKLATLGTVLAGIAHDIANPSSLILTRSIQLRKLSDDTEGFLETLLGDVDDPQSQEVKREFSSLFERARHLAQEVELAAMQINSINSAIRNQAREDDWLPEVKLDEVVDECLVILSLSFTDIEVRREQSDQVTLTCSRSRLGQVVMNLLKNAADSIHSVAEQGVVKVTTAYQGNEVLLRIEDSGPGFEFSDTQKIFDVFYTTKEVGKGTGLGLPIVARVVDEHGGTIDVSTSTELGGASFAISLPQDASGKNVAR